MDSIMEFLRHPPPPSTLFNAYASLSASLMILRSTPNPLPAPIKKFLWSKIKEFFLNNKITSTTTVLIDEKWGAESNLLFTAAKNYLSGKVSPANLSRVKMGKIRSKKNISVGLPQDIKVTDEFHGTKFTWCLIISTKNEKQSPKKRTYVLSFDSKNRDETLTSTYLNHVMEVSASISQEDKELRIFSCNSDHHSQKGTYLQHPASFDTIAMDPKLKQSIIDDLDKFLSRKDYYRRIGKAWKRGYLLYGPPGTGKSSLVVAMAKYLKYDVYDLELSSIHSNSQLRSIFLGMSSKSILVIEDVDCYEEVHARSETVEDKDQKRKKRDSCTLSGLLNAIDGLWSGCGEERIIVFTTNHKDKIDPALLRPGRMDMHIELSYLTPSAFPVLAYNYLGVGNGEHPIVDEIKGLLENTEVTPASVAEELLRSDGGEVDAALGGVVEFLKRKRVEEGNDGGNGGTRANLPESKRMKWLSSDDED